MGDKNTKAESVFDTTHAKARKMLNSLEVGQAVEVNDADLIKYRNGMPAIAKRLKIRIRTRMVDGVLFIQRTE